MEKDFTVRTHREGTVETTPDMETIITNMGCTSFTNRATGTVTIVVEKVNRVITKEKIKWGADNDPVFNESQTRNAEALLPLAVSQVNGGGDDNGEIRIRIATKL